ESALEDALRAISDALYPFLKDLLSTPDLAGLQSLILVPTGALHRFPLHALPWPSEDVRLMDLYSVSYAMSADVFALSGRRPAASTGLAALAPSLSAGNADPPTTTLALAAALSALAGELPYLRERASASLL